MRFHQLLNYRSVFKIASKGRVILVVSALVGGVANLIAAPTGGIVKQGSASISSNGATTTITQSTSKTSIDWQSFNIATNETVNFVQPSSSSVALNRVIGVTPSLIQGAMHANGQVFLVNPNGIIFSKDSSVNVGGIVASTLNISDNDFLNSNYNFSGSSTASILNEGTIKANNGGYIAMIGKTIINKGLVEADLGNIQLAGAGDITLNLNGNSLLFLTINKGTLNALVENGGIIKADGGNIYLTTQALNTVLDGLVNNTGVIQAEGLENKNGNIVLFAHGGTADVGGTITTGQQSGNVETSGEEFKTRANLSIKTGAWLIDPVDITIDSNLANTINTALTAGSVTIETTGGNTPSTSSGETTAIANGDITINSAMNWSANTLTLSAGDNININAQLDLTNTAGLSLKYAQTAGSTGDYNINAPVNIATTGSFSTQNGVNTAINYTIINSLGSAGSVTGTDLQGISGNLSGKYVLGSNIDATSTSTWNSGVGFTPLGKSGAIFTGIFDGLGHTIDKLYENATVSYTGLFGYTNTATLRNIGVTNASITTTKDSSGVLVGGLFSTSNVKNSYTTGTVTSSYNSSSIGFYGGLVGSANNSIIKDSHANVTVKGTGAYSFAVGGFVGQANNVVQITNSYATGNVSATGTSGGKNIGGFVGYLSGNTAITFSTITNSYSTGNVSSTGTSTGSVGGFVGNSVGVIKNSYSTGTVTAVANYSGGFAGAVSGDYLLTENSYSTGNVTSTGNYVGGFIGNIANDVLATGLVRNSYSTGNVNATGTLSNNIGGFAGAGWGIDITNSYSTGNVSATGTSASSIGGFIGRSGHDTQSYVLYIDKCYSTGQVITSATNINTTIGGFVGKNNSMNSTISNSYWDMDTSGKTNGYGTNAGTITALIGLSDTQMHQQSNFTNLDFTSNWISYDGYTTPLLRALMTPLTVTANNVTATYNATSHSQNGANYSISSPDNSILLGTLNYSYGTNSITGISSDTTNAGTIAITPLGLYSNQKGYSITYVDGTMTINPAQITLTANSTKTYDGTTAITNGITIGGLVGTETLTYTNATANSANVIGASYVNNLTLVSALGRATNYIVPTLSSSSDNIVTITPANLTVVANNDAKFVTQSDNSTYNGVSYTGFVNGENNSVLGGSLVINRTNSTTNLAGIYSDVLEASGYTSDNYNISYSKGEYTIVPSNQLLVKVNNINNAYGTSVPYSIDEASYWDPNANSGAGSVVVLNSITNNGNNNFTVNDGVGGSATFTVVPNNAQYSTSNHMAFGSYQLALSNTTTTNSQNFSNTITLTGAHQVDKSALDLATASGLTKVYDGTNTISEVNLSLASLQAGDLVNLSSSGTFSSKNVGSNLSYTLNDLLLSGNDASNYYIANGSNTTRSDGVITPKTLTLSATKTYDGTTSLNGGVTISGLVGNETLAYSGATSNDSHVATANKYINAITLVDGTNDGLAGNYELPTLDNSNAAVTIVAKTITPTLSNINVTKVYDGDATTSITPTYNISGLISGDTVATLSNTSKTYNSINVAEANKVTVNGLVISSIEGTNNSVATDYYLSTNTLDVAASITPKTLTLSATINETTPFHNQSYKSTSNNSIFIPLLNTQNQQISSDINLSNMKLFASSNNLNDGSIQSITIDQLSKNLNLNQNEIKTMASPQINNMFIIAGGVYLPQGVYQNVYIELIK